MRSRRAGQETERSLETRAQGRRPRPVRRVRGRRRGRPGRGVSRPAHRGGATRLVGSRRPAGRRPRRRLPGPHADARPVGAPAPKVLPIRRRRRVAGLLGVRDGLRLCESPALPSPHAARRHARGLGRPDRGGRQGPRQSHGRRAGRPHRVPAQVARGRRAVLRPARPTPAERPPARARAARARHARDAEPRLLPAARPARRLRHSTQAEHALCDALRRPRAAGLRGPRRRRRRRGRRRPRRRRDAAACPQETRVQGRRTPRADIQGRGRGRSRHPRTVVRGRLEHQVFERDGPRLLARDRRALRAVPQNHDALGQKADLGARQVLALRKLPDPELQERRGQTRRAFRFRGRLRDLQVARVAPSANRQAAHHLGLQNTLLGRPLPPGRPQNHLRRRGPSRPRRPPRALGTRPQGQALRVHPLLRLQTRDPRLSVLALRLLGRPPPRQALPHLRALRRRPQPLSPHGRRRPASSRLRSALSRPQLPRQSRSGPPQLRPTLHSHLLPPPALALVRILVLRRLQARLQNHRPLQQPSPQGKQARHGAPRHQRLPLPRVLGPARRRGQTRRLRALTATRLSRLAARPGPSTSSCFSLAEEETVCVCVGRSTASCPLPRVCGHPPAVADRRRPGQRRCALGLRATTADLLHQ
mmetsp:Transcript_9674/g.31024  ORF Transcript_9674/g.31024 Transcript_9674/m.31024 type:complete len:647 (-) Transcript_9674:58-1998(-)